MASQGVILFLINLIIDYMMNNRYKGSDKKQETVERDQLPESQDVINHKELSDRIWDMPLGCSRFADEEGRGICNEN